jgi:O-antigen/teichoic acid export membrane protein
MKPTVGKVQPRPRVEAKPDRRGTEKKEKRGKKAATPQSAEDNRLADLMVISLTAGGALMVATLLLVAVAAPLGYLGADLGGMTGAKIGFGLGLALGLGLIALVLRRFGPRLRSRSPNLLRGAWLGTIVAAVVLVFLYYLPNVALPMYCPPGAICSNGQP